MQNKKILFLTSGLLTLIIFIFVFYNITNINNNPIIIGKINKIEYKDNNIISLMYETGLDTEEYEKSTSNTWPGDDYIFNSTLSGCENGGKLSWNQQTNKITLLNNTSDRCYIYFDVYNKAVINNVTSSVTNNSITVNVSATAGENPISRYYYSINNQNYISSASNTYTFSGLSAGTNYNIRVYVRDANGVDSNVYTINAETTNLTYICDSRTTLASCIRSQYTSQGSNGIYYHTSSLANSAEDNSYRYAGANPNNYVCFGSDSATCPSDSLYRIIGVFGDEVKLIKNTSIGSYYWSGSSSNQSNTWRRSSLNIYTLNGSYLAGLDNNSWSSMITTHTWKVGGMSSSNGRSTPQTAYNYEVGANSSSTPYNAKIGLMYVSDYGFAASNTYWSTNLSSYNNATSNWLYLDSNEWTISRCSDRSDFAFFVHSGYVDYYYVSNSSRVVRPVFYLTSDTLYSSGTGTISDPIRIQ